MSECILWSGYIDQAGYGRFGRHGYAHRRAYEEAVGPIPEGLTIDHLCRVRACINPEHMEPVTRGENVLRGVGPAAMAARVTHCPQGHAYAGWNLTIKKDGARRCRTCHNAQEKARMVMARG